MLPPYGSPYISQNPDIYFASPEMGDPQYMSPMMPMSPMSPMMPMTPFTPFQPPHGIRIDDAIPTVAPMTQSYSDPPPLLSNNPVTTSIVLFKELTAYPNYGNPSRNADILYTGNRGTWTFDSPAFLFVPGNLRAQITIRAALDDHSNVPVNRYALKITINDRVVHDGRVPLEHGTPAGGMFTNWRELNFNIPNMRRSTRVTIQNTSTANPDDWIGFDWMQIRFTPR